MNKSMGRLLARASVGGVLVAALSVLGAGAVAARTPAPSEPATSRPPVSAPEPGGLALSQPRPATSSPTLAAAATRRETRLVAASPRTPVPRLYRSGSLGFDISQYQCGHIPAVRPAVAVVQVTGGALNNPPNPCYVREATWAGSHLSAYIYLDGLPNPAPPESLSGPAARCARSNPACQAYDFGFNWAAYWLAYSRRLGIDPTLWWLDVELGAGWTSPAINAPVIRGAIDGLRTHGVRVGIYSTPYQWATIAGALTVPGAPVWTAGAGNLTGPGYTATNYCSDPNEAFAGGHLSMVQWGYSGTFAGAYQGPSLPYDNDYVCKPA